MLYEKKTNKLQKRKLILNKNIANNTFALFFAQIRIGQLNENDIGAGLYSCQNNIKIIANDVGVAT